MEQDVRDCSTSTESHGPQTTQDGVSKDNKYYGQVEREREKPRNVTSNKSHADKQKYGSHIQRISSNHRRHT